MVNVKGYEVNGGTRACVFCTRPGCELFDCEFRDGLKGHLCRACFTRALRVRSAERKDGPQVPGPRAEGAK